VLFATSADDDTSNSTGAADHGNGSPAVRSKVRGSWSGSKSVVDRYDLTGLCRTLPLFPPFLVPPPRRLCYLDAPVALAAVL
jgi:hypothetical protein